ncbi:ABC transporter ATP-binding protein [Candidatus Burkholderia verschuerenii]|uniref:Energy-dependent translational throttle protein EttA n=2 Tax=Candidatus Burkholderia verschuerenii TaxID=242163 RepID=A0A0L0M9D8_9BURK|nr:ABC transporter ATP-binding protein [Candidatus Burkholderia verschuerenii]
MKRFRPIALLALIAAFTASTPVYAYQSYGYQSQPDESDLDNHGHYVNRDGNTVHSPAHSRSGAIPQGATAQCRDGSYSSASITAEPARATAACRDGNDLPPHPRPAPEVQCQLILPAPTRRAGSASLSEPRRQIPSNAESRAVRARHSHRYLFITDIIQMAQYVFTMNRVGKIVPPKRQILKDISLSFFPGAKIGLLGLNGSGKSTLIRIMAGVDKDIEGEATPMPNLNIGYLPQEPQLDPKRTVRQAVEEGLGDVFQAQKKLDEIYAAYAEPDADFDALAAEQAKYEAILATSDGGSPEQQLEVAADALRLPAWDATIEHLSGGEKRRVALCKLLLQKPDMLLLDEPTNHLDAESVEWLEQFLTRYPGTVVAVTHDRYFLDNAAEWILELDRGHGIPWKGNYSSWLDQKEDRLKQEEASESARQKAIKKELEWVRQNPKGRQAKSKARIARFEELNSQEYQKRNETQEIFIPVGDRLGNEVIEFMNVSKAYGDRLLIDNLSMKIPAGAIVGIIGPNGAGKSTLFRMLTGKEQPDSGEIVKGPTVNLAYVDQSRDALAGDKTVFEEISGGADVLTVGKYETPSRAYIGRFNFKGSDQQKLVGNLSGGERGRLHLAKTLIAGGNVLLLDEPSNDLDVETLRALEDALLEFAGSVMVISHDRWFLDRIATHIIAFEGDSHVEFFDGNYQEYEADKRKRLDEEAAKPKRLRYKPITR